MAAFFLFAKKNMDYDELRKTLDWLQTLKFNVGWPDGNKTADTAYENLQRKKRTGKNQPSLKKPVSLALIGRTLNYGREPGVTAEGVRYGRIPARPFMKVAVDIAAKKFPRILKKYVPMLTSGMMTRETFKTYVGQRLRDCVVEAMRKSEAYTPLAPSTVKRRRNRSNVPLIDTGTLLSSVSFEVIEGV